MQVATRQKLQHGLELQSYCWYSVGPSTPLSKCQSHTMMAVAVVLHQIVKVDRKWRKWTCLFWMKPLWHLAQCWRALTDASETSLDCVTSLFVTRPVFQEAIFSKPCILSQEVITCELLYQTFGMCASNIVFRNIFVMIKYF